MAVPLALRFFRGQLLPRMRRLIFSKVVGFSVVVSVGLGVALPVLPAGVLPISDVANVGITFASIAMGACIAAVVLSVGLPGPDRLRRWANLPGSVAGHSALSDLVFVLVWATLAQVALILVCVLSIAFGGTLPLAPVGMIPTHAAGLHVGLLVFFYALFELTVVVQTLSQMAAVVIVEEQLPSPGSPAIH